MMKTLKIAWYLSLGLLLFAGCSKDKSIGEPDEPETPAEVTLELSDADLVFEADGGQKTFTITCDAGWTITNESDWCTTDVTSGTGDRTVTVTAQTYENALEDRNMNLTVKAGGKAKVLTVTQKHGNAIVPDKAKFEVPQEGGDLAIRVRSNMTYEVTIPENCSSWIQPAPETRSEVSDTTYRFIISENETDDSRTGYIIFSAASLSDTVRIYQAQKDRLVLTQTKYKLPFKDTTIIAELKTNVDYEVSVLGDAASWISRMETRANRVDRLQFHIEENTGEASRNAKIAVQDKNGMLSDTLYIRQWGTNGADEEDITADFAPAFAGLLQRKGYIPDSTRILVKDIKDIDTLDVSGTFEDWKAGKGLTSLAGIEHFESLTKLYCSYNQLTSLDVSKNTALTWLYCDANQLTSLDISGCTALIQLDCWDNQLTSLDVSGCTALNFLFCFYNQLTSLDVSNNTALIRLFCNDNQLTSLDMSGCTALIQLDCYSNQLISLDISGCTALTWLSCRDNQLTSLDMSGCTALIQLNCYSNPLISLDISGCTALTSLICDSEQLTFLDVSGCTALIGLNCNNNQLTSLDVSGCTALTSLWCSSNQLTSLDVSGCTALVKLFCNQNQLTSLDVSKNTALTYLFCYNNPGDGESLFPITAWFDKDNIPENMQFYYNNDFDGKTWGYDGKNIRIDFRKAE